MISRYNFTGKNDTWSLVCEWFYKTSLSLGCCSILKEYSLNILIEKLVLETEFKFDQYHQLAEPQKTENIEPVMSTSNKNYMATSLANGLTPTQHSQFTSRIICVHA